MKKGGRSRPLTRRPKGYCPPECEPEPLPGVVLVDDPVGLELSGVLAPLVEPAPPGRPMVEPGRFMPVPEPVDDVPDPADVPLPEFEPEVEPPVPVLSVPVLVPVPVLPVPVVPVVPLLPEPALLPDPDPPLPPPACARTGPAAIVSTIAVDNRNNRIKSSKL